jgi:hypothetical protein
MLREPGALLLWASLALPSTLEPAEAHRAQEPNPAAVGVVCKVKVLSDKVEDVSSLEAWKESFIKEGNTITFSAGPPEGTITLEGSGDLGNKGKQLVYTDFHPQVTNISEPNLSVSAREGSIAFPVRTPGDMVRLRFGCHYRARHAKDGWDSQVSLDQGRTFKTVDRAPGPTEGYCKYISYSDIPPGTQEALVRFSGTDRSTTTMIFDFRIDADYKEPGAGFRPVKVTYTWEEDGKPKEHVHVARAPDEKYAIVCDAKPVMKSIVLELAE